MSASRLHCLIVDDHSTTALSLKATLSLMGFATFGFAASTPQAMAAAKTRRPDLVVTSMALGSAAADIDGAPIIYLGAEAGAVDGDIVLDKPVGRAALANAWERLRDEAVVGA